MTFGARVLATEFSPAAARNTSHVRCPARVHIYGGIWDINLINLVYSAYFSVQLTKSSKMDSPDPRPLILSRSFGYLIHI
jgi:hypothetical protein